MQKFNELLPEQLNTAVALGFFDGLHLGHRQVLEAVTTQKKNGLLPVCFTFEQSPKSILRGEAECALMTGKDKLNTLEELGIEHTFCIDFNSVMNMPAEKFVQDVLYDKLKARLVACGFNYHFGKNGEGDCKKLVQMCNNYGIDVKVIPPQQSNGRVVSSTLIRELIKEGKIEKANEILGSRFGFSSVIRHGNRLGRRLGTPTINQPLCPQLAVPKFGVYASIITLENSKTYCGVTNIGIKPTVGSPAPLCETWMPEYDGGEIYGESADIRLLSFIREEKKFDDTDELKQAIIENGKTALSIYKAIKYCDV